METLIKPFSEIRISDVAEVGGKNASLGEMFATLATSGIAVPNGFATTSLAFRMFLEQNKLMGRLQELLQQLDRTDYSNLNVTGAGIRNLFQQAELPVELVSAITLAYSELGKGEDIHVAVRSSATAEDLPSASFAGQHESYLNISGAASVVAAVKNCFTSLYTNRAIKYREEHGIAHELVSISAGIQKMVRSDKAASGVIFTLEPESGFRDLVHISGVWGLGENMVQGTVNPDTWLVFKPTLAMGKNAIIQKKRGSMDTMLQYDDTQPNSLLSRPVPDEQKLKFTLSDEEVTQLANWAVLIEEHYQMPMDIEWAKDGISGFLYIIQARPETVHQTKDPLLIEEWTLLGKNLPLCTGEAIGESVVSGIARLLNSPDEVAKLNPGDIIVTSITSPDWDPLLRRSGGIVTNKGGRTSHAAIVAREAGVPAIVGCGNATEMIRDGDTITVSCCEGKKGFVYPGQVPFTKQTINLKGITKPAAPRVMLIGSSPEKAFQLSFYPNDGVGLLRLEFIITHEIGIHPMALAKFNELKDADVRRRIEDLTLGYTDKKQYFIDNLAYGIAAFGAAFYPKDVIVRMSDLKTNEYAGLLGGTDFEPDEENPMIGFRGASRYYNPLYAEGFGMECRAVARVRDEMGLKNVKVMIPFCRTVDEGRKVIGVMKENGLIQHQSGLEIYVMAEIPSNVILCRQFAEIFDGFSIGSNDLTQLTLGVDRDSAILRELFNEENEAVKILISQMTRVAHEAGRKVGFCGQAPSDIPAFASFLSEIGVDSVSFNPDALLKGIQRFSTIKKEPVSQSMESDMSSAGG